MALRRWRPLKRCCQVVYYLAKELSIKVDVKSLTQLAFLGYQAVLVEKGSAVVLRNWADQGCIAVHVADVSRTSQ